MWKPILLVPGVYKHVNCRNAKYPESDIKRFNVPNHYVFWSVLYTEYSPPNYTALHIVHQQWADPEIGTSQFKPKWNCVDGVVNRISHNGQYELDKNSGWPLNPMGRTGLRGRGLLGRWGPNHAADPIVTRWKRNIDGDIMRNSVTQNDNKSWAIPGGMIDSGESFSTTLRREFMEEALNSMKDRLIIEKFFSSGSEVYRGYVDDYRNTDNAWIETIAFNYHDESGSEISRISLSAGDDAINVKWIDVHSDLYLHASHRIIIHQIAGNLNSHW